MNNDNFYGIYYNVVKPADIDNYGDFLYQTDDVTDMGKRLSNYKTYYKNLSFLYKDPTDESIETTSNKLLNRANIKRMCCLNKNDIDVSFPVLNTTTNVTEYKFTNLSVDAATKQKICADVYATDKDIEAVLKDQSSGVVTGTYLTDDTNKTNKLCDAFYNTYCGYLKSVIPTDPDNFLYSNRAGRNDCSCINSDGYKRLSGSQQVVSGIGPDYNICADGWCNGSVAYLPSDYKKAKDCQGFCINNTKTGDIVAKNVTITASCDTTASTQTKPPTIPVDIPPPVKPSTPEEAIPPVVKIPISIPSTIPPSTIPPTTTSSYDKKTEETSSLSVKTTTQETSTQETSTKSNTGLFVGLGIGGGLSLFICCLIIILIIVFVIYYNRKR